MQDFTPTLASERRQTRLGAGLLFLVVVIWFSPLWLGGRVLAPLDLPGQLMQPWAKSEGIPQVHNHFVTDAITQYLPYRMFAEKSFQEDGYIGWCSLTFQGFAQDANTMGLFSDWTMQLHRWLPFWTAWHLGLAGQFLIAGWGMLLFLRHRGFSGPAAWAGAVAYMGNAQFVIWIYHRWALSAFCWLPWLLWAIYRGQAAKKTQVAPAFFLALAICGGTLQYATYTLLAYGLVALGIVWQPVCEGLRKQQITRFIWWLAAGFGLAAFYWIPAAEAYWVNLQTGNLRGGLGYGGGWRQPLLNLLSYPATIFPWVFGRVASLDLWKIWQSSLINLGWFGFLPTLLAFVTIFLRKTPLPARLLMIVGWLIPLTPLVGPLYHRVVLLSILGGIWSFAWLLESGFLKDDFYQRLWKIGAGLLAVWLIVSWGVVSFQNAILEKILPYVISKSANSQFGLFTDWTIERTARFFNEIVVWHWAKWIPLTIAFVTLAIAQKWSKWNHLRWLLGGVLAVELSFFFFDWTTWCPTNRILPKSSLVNAIVKEVKIDQLLYQVETGPMYLSGSTISTLPLPPNLLMPMGIPVLTGYESIMPPRIWQNTSFSTQANVLSSLGVAHILLSANSLAPDGWQWITTAEKQTLWKNPAALPHYQCWLNSASPTTISATVLKRTENHRMLQVPAHTIKVLIRENWHKGWKYRLAKGKWQDVFRAANGSQSLLFYPNNSSMTVEMRYFPGWWGWPGVISLATVCLLLIGMIKNRYQPNFPET